MKEVSLGKFLRISKIPETEMYLKVSESNYWDDENNRFEIYVKKEILLKTKEFLYFHNKVWDTTKEDNYRSIISRIGLECTSAKDLLENSLNLEDLLTSGGICSEFKTRKLCVKLDYGDLFND